MILPDGRSFESSQELLNEAIDIHVHAGPHLISSPRRVDPFQAAIEARDAGMRAIVFMDNFGISSGTSWMVNRLIPDFQTFGGLILSTIYNGLNPRAVKTAINYGDGAKFICFGTHSTCFQASREGRLEDGKYVTLSQKYKKFRDEELKRCISIPTEEPPGPELNEILQLIADNPQMYLITGHVSAEEAVRLVELSSDYGIERMVVSGAVTKIAGINQLKRMIESGAFIEYTMASYNISSPKTHYYVEREYASGGKQDGIMLAADQIRKIGVDHCIASTDLGVYTGPTPVEGFRELIATLLDIGFTAEEIRKIVKTNPEKLLGI
jgi:hypothetical protein